MWGWLAIVIPWFTAFAVILIVLWQLKSIYEAYGRIKAEKKSMEIGESAQQREDKARRRKHARDLLDDLKRVRDSDSS